MVFILILKSVPTDTDLIMRYDYNKTIVNDRVVIYAQVYRWMHIYKYIGEHVYTLIPHRPHILLIVKDFHKNYGGYYEKAYKK